LSGLAVAALAVCYAGGVGEGAFDHWARSRAEQLMQRSGPETFQFLVSADLGSAATLIVLVALVCLCLGNRRLAVIAMVGPPLVGVVTSVLKPVIGRVINGEYAFPSGHTAVITAMALILGPLMAGRFALRRTFALLLVLTFAGLCGGVMALALVAGGNHYASDTIGGFLTALAIVPAIALVVDGCL